MEKFLNIYSKYPWVALIIVAHWIATVFILTQSETADAPKILGLAFVSTIIFTYFGFKIPK